MRLNNDRFKFVCEIIPSKAPDGKPLEFYPYMNYKKDKRLNKYGKGPFCKFKIPDNINRAGVYIIKVNGKVKYVGECEDLSRRFNSGYGQISPRNCFIGGQATNCKINSYILLEIKKGAKVQLYFYETKERFLLERELINKYKPEWNSTSGKAVGKSKWVKKNKYKNVKGVMLRAGKYDPLKDFLKNCSDSRVQLTYKKIEEIIEKPLPDSAYKYREWWANGGHSQADAWLEAGWKVDHVGLGEYVVFIKENG